MIRVLALAAAGSLVLSACTGGGGDSATPTTIVRLTTTTVAPTTTDVTIPDHRAFAFVAGALSDNTVDSLDGASAFVTAGSPAEMYLAHRAAIAGLGPTSPRAVTTLSEERYTMCGDQNGCVTLSEPHIGSDGSLFDFAIDGTRVADLVAEPVGAVTVDALDVSLVSAFLRSDARLVVVYDVTNAGDTQMRVAGFAARYDRTDAGSVDAITHAGGGEIAPGATVRVVSAFDDADLGGTMIVAGGNGDWTTSWDAAIPLAARP